MLPFGSVYHMSWHFYHRSQIAHIRKDKHFFLFYVFRYFLKLHLLFFAGNIMIQDKKNRISKQAQNVSQFQRDMFYILIERSVPGGMHEIKRNALFHETCKLLKRPLNVRRIFTKVHHKKEDLL